jgi:surfeit locus 1 family protein
MSLARWRAAGLVWPSLLSVAGLAVLIGLGTWQLSRKAWKEGLIAAIEARTTAPPRDIDAVISQADGPVGAEYARVRAAGRFLHDQERHLFMPDKEGPGWHVITPLVRDDSTVVLVNRGWVPDRLREPPTRSAGQPTGGVGVVGLLRRSETPGLFAPDNEPAANRWYWRELPAMAQCRPGSSGTSSCRALQAARSLPFVIDAEAEPANPGGWPRGGTTRLSLPNRHLEYALTWYGLAATLIGVFAAFAVTRLKAAPPPD